MMNGKVSEEVRGRGKFLRVHPHLTPLPSRERDSIWCYVEDYDNKAQIGQTEIAHGIIREAK
jgi:hypothetical protein